jgi:peptidyl-dipeptidase Dcp
MQRLLILSAFAGLGLMLNGQPTKAARPSAANPFYQKWSTPFGAPPFPRIRPVHFMPAIRKGMADQKAEIAKITANPAPATFDNTILALERSGQLLTNAATVFFNLIGAESSPALEKIELEVSPLLTRHGNEILQNEKLFARVEAVYAGMDQAKLDAVQRRLVERTRIGFIRSGAQLTAEARKRMAAIDERMSTLGTQFNQNLLADSKEFILVLETEADMAGLPSFVREAAAAEAKERGMTKAGVVTISRSSFEPFMMFSARRDLREKLFRAWTLRGDNDNKFDNKKYISEMVSLRAERARLMGFASFAHFSLDDQMAKKPEAAMELMMRVWKPAREQALRDRDSLQRIMNKEGIDGKLQPWDWRYYAEKLRKEQYDLEETQVKPYFQLEKMIDAQFYTAQKLFGLSFTERRDIPGWHPDVRVWEVKDRSGRHVALFYGDYFARPTKRSGAWMNSYRDQQRLIGEITPIVGNHCNFNKGAAGKPVLLSYDDAETLFHEFGHALHGMLSNVVYPRLSGTNTPSDYVELPSQIYEHWLGTREILEKFAVHYETGAPMPAELLEKVRKSRTFNQGFSTVEFLGSALVDMDFHLRAGTEAIDVREFEKASLARIGMPEEITMRHRSPHFSHIFGGGYAAGYYSYMWAEVLDADGFEAFKEAGDVFDPAVAKRLLENIYSTGNSRDLMETYRLFRGKEPAVEPLLKNRGLQ